MAAQLQPRSPIRGMYNRSPSIRTLSGMVKPSGFVPMPDLSPREVLRLAIGLSPRQDRTGSFRRFDMASI